MTILKCIEIIGIAVSTCGVVFGVIAFCVIKFNDLYHTDLKLEKVDVKLDEQGKEIKNLSVQISGIDGYIKGKIEKQDL